MASFQTPGVAFVTGAASGIGKAVANAFVEAGARVVVFADINEAGALQAARASAEYTPLGHGYTARGIKIDVADAESVASAFKEVVDEFKRIDYLVNGAGVDCDYAKIPDDNLEEFDRLMSVNAKGMLLCTREAAKYMKQQQPEPATHKTKAGKERKLSKGYIVNILSVISFVGVPSKVAYVASKHAALGVTSATVQDLRGENIRVNSVAPGWVRTAMFEGEAAKTMENSGLPKEEWTSKYLEAIGSFIPVEGRPSEPEEIGEAAVFLCSPAASYAYGTTLTVDGGVTLTLKSGM